MRISHSLSIFKPHAGRIPASRRSPYRHRHGPPSLDEWATRELAKHVAKWEVWNESEARTALFDVWDTTAGMLIAWAEADAATCEAALAAVAT